MKIVTAFEMREIDRKTIEGYGIAGLVLMERAGLAVARAVKERFCKHKALVIAGSGNNGGDGIVIARELHNAGFNVKVIMAGGAKVSPDFRIQLGIAKRMGIPVEQRVSIDRKDTHGAVIIDALFGTGLSKNISGALSKLITSINASGSPIVSVDIPSGISADTGEVLGAGVRADLTVTFGLPKRGHYLYPGVEFTGELITEDIGFPAELLFGPKLKCNLLRRKELMHFLPLRHAYSHKGDYGHVLVAAGSRGKTGAALMTARACMRSGAGLVTIAAPESVIHSLESQTVEEMLLPLPETDQGGLGKGAMDAVLEFIDHKADVLAIGPGIGQGAETCAIVKKLISRVTVPMVIDADGLNAIAGNVKLLRSLKAPCVITPHTGEFARLTGKTVQEIERDRIGSASAFARAAGVYVVLKGTPTVIAEPDGETFVSTGGNPGMATAGAGDVLTGIIAAFLGQGLPPLLASSLGVFMHGLAGDLAAEKKGMHSMLASDIMGYMPDAFGMMKDKGGL